MKKSEKHLKEITGYEEAEEQDKSLIINPDSVPTITIRDYLKAGYSLLHIRTDEDHRAVSKVISAIEDIDSMSGSVFFGEWRSTTGLLLAPQGDFIIPPDTRPQAGTEDIISALKFIQNQTNPHVIIYHNIRQFLPTPGVIQQLKDASFRVRLVGSHIILIGANLDPPPELQNLITVYDLPLPNQEKFSETFSTFAGAYKDSLNKEIEIKDIELCASAAVGMTHLQGENALALSIIMKKELSPTIIQLEKEQAIKRNDVLEFIHVKESMDQLGGFKELKKWVSKRKDSFSPEAREYGLSFSKGVLLLGIPGCIDGDSLIPIKKLNGPGGRYMSIKSLYYRFNRKVFEGIEEGVLSRHIKQWKPDRVIKTYSINEDSGLILANTIHGVIHSGVKSVYRVTTEYGMYTGTTENHRFYTPDGEYVPLNKLRVGDSVVIRGGRNCKGKHLKSFSTGRNHNITSLQISNVGKHPNARVRIINNLAYTTHPLHRLVVEAYMNKLTLEDFLFALNTDIKGLKFLPSDIDVHHVDGDRKNNTIKNLRPMTKQEHAKLHLKDRGALYNKYVVMGRIQKISSIEYLGEKDTYDIQMEDPYNSFVSDGFVVHNSGKSLCSKTIAHYLGLPLIKFDIGKVFKSLVGSSESAVRSALKTIEAVAPATVWLEELEKSMAGSQSSGNSDSGTTARVMSTILTWMQENTKPIFLVATANSVTALPPELLRKGRFSEVWGVIEPNPEERAEIWRIHIGKVRPHRLDEFDIDELVSLSEGYTGAEIENAVEEAMFDAWDDNRREMTTEDMVKAIKSIVPQSITSKESIDLIRDWMIKRTRFVSGWNPYKEYKKEAGEKSAVWRKLRTATEKSSSKTKNDN